MSSPTQRSARRSQAPRRPRGVSSIAVLVALSAFECGGAAGAMARGCGKASSGGRAASRTATTANGAHKTIGVRGIHKLGTGGGAMARADDVGRLGLEDGFGAYAARSAADDSALARLAEHSLDLADLAQLTLDEDEVVSVVDARGVEFKVQDAADSEAPPPRAKVRVYSFLHPSAEVPEFALFKSTFALREVSDLSAKPDAVWGLELAAWPASFVVVIASEEPVATSDASTARNASPPQRQLLVGLNDRGRPIKQSVHDFAARCVGDTQVCVVLGCDPQDQVRCGMAAVDLVHACRGREQAFTDCLRARGDADPRGPSVSIALKLGARLRVLRSTRTMAD